MIRTLQTNLTGGVISADARERLDLAVWKNSVAELTNLRVHPQGGASRRPGLAFVDHNPAHHLHRELAYQIEPFIFADGQEYVFVIGAGYVGIYFRQARSRFMELGAPWSEAVIRNNELSIVQAYDTMLLFHKDYETRRITRNSAGTFEMSTLQWSPWNDGTQTVVRPPFHKYALGHVTMWTDGGENSPTTGTLNVNTSDPFFQAGHIGTFVNLKGHYIYIADVITSVLAIGILQSAAIPEWETHTINWQEQAFSPVRGWARTGCLHQQRLVIGGGRDIPNVIWASTTYDPFNFYLGTAQPTDAIKYMAAADRIAEIERMVSYTHLQVYTADGEFFVPTPEGQALTPTTFSLRQQSGYGIAHAPAIRFDQSTIFISRAANAIREFVYDGQQLAYSSDALTFMAKDLVRFPSDIAASMETQFAQESLALVMNYDGTLAVLSKVRKENVGAWMLWTTNGVIRHVGVINREIWALVWRWHPEINDWRMTLEVFDPNYRLDFSVRKTSATPTTTWSFPSLAGQAEVHLRSGDLYLGTVSMSGSDIVTTPIAVSDLEAGLAYSCSTTPLVQEVQKPDGLSWGEPRRICSTTVSLVDSIGGDIDGDSLPFDNAEHDPGKAPDRFTGKFQSWRLGWGISEAPVIRQDKPLPFHIRAIGMEVEI